jgi:hypothetical protein
MIFTLPTLKYWAIHNLGFSITLMLISASMPGQSPTFKPDLYIIAIGVSEYVNYPDKKLEFADNDALEIIKKFNASGMYNKVYSFPVIDSAALRENILPLRNKLMKTHVDDQVILFFSGHGILDTTTLDFYFCTYNFDAGKAAMTGITFEEMEYLLDSIPSRKKLFLIDACHSGEVDKDALREQQPAKSVIDKNSKTFTPANFNSSQSTFDLMKEMFIDIRKSTGSTVLASSGGLSKSFEEKTWNQGIFTQAILTSLTKGITVSQLLTTVPKLVYELSFGRQFPVIRQENIEFDYPIW